MKGIDPFSHFTFTLTSLLRPTEHLLLIRERFFPFIWLPDILLGARTGLRNVKDGGYCGAAEDESGHLSISGLEVCVLSLFLIWGPGKWFSRGQLLSFALSSWEDYHQCSHWWFNHGIKILWAIFVQNAGKVSSPMHNSSAKIFSPHHGWLC